MLPRLARSRRSALLAAIPVLALALVVTAGTLRPVIGGGSTPSPSPVAAAQPTPAPTPSPLPSPTATPAPSPTATPSGVPLVPIVGFWSERRTISRDELADALDGKSPGPSPNPLQIVVSSDDLGALAALLHVAAFGARSMAPAGVVAFVKATPNALGIIRADDVALGVRAIAVDGVQLFGAARIHDMAAWPLNVAEPGVVSDFVTAAKWTIAAGGDVLDNLGINHAGAGSNITEAQARVASGGRSADRRAGVLLHRADRLLGHVDVARIGGLLDR